RAGVIRRIEEDTALTADVRAAALVMAKQREEDPDTLNAMSWRVVAAADAGLDSYATALRQAEVACSLKPDNWACRNTLGVAMYRNLRFQEALETLMRSDRIYSLSRGDHRPTDL